MDGSMNQTYEGEIQKYEAFADSIAKLERRAVEQILAGNAGTISFEYYKKKALHDVLISKGESARYGGYSGIDAIAASEMDTLKFLNLDGKFQYMTDASLKNNIIDAVFDNLRANAEKLGLICNVQLSTFGQEMHSQMGLAKMNAEQMKFHQSKSNKTI